MRLARPAQYYKYLFEDADASEVPGEIAVRPVHILSCMWGWTNALHRPPPKQLGRLRPVPVPLVEGYGRSHRTKDHHCRARSIPGHSPKDTGQKTKHSSASSLFLECSQFALR